MQHRPNRLRDTVLDIAPRRLSMASILGAGAILLFLLHILGTYFGGVTSVKFFLALALFLVVSVVTRFPDRFRPALSLKVGMGLTILVTVYGGVIYGLIFAIVSVLVEAFVVFEFPQETPITFITRIIFCVLLPSMFPFAGSSLAMYTLPFIVAQYTITTPLRVVTGNNPLFFQLQYALFNCIWHTWFFWVFEANLVSLLGV